MAKKIICESCGTIFPFDKAKDLASCPVCGFSFEEDDSVNSDSTQTDMYTDYNGTMYFHDIHIFKEQPECSYVSLHCGECGETTARETKYFDELVDKSYVTLKSNVVLKCEKCGREQKPRKILYKPLPPSPCLLPHCPVCNSIVLHKLSLGSKFISAAFLGDTATYECRNCGYRF